MTTKKESVVIYRSGQNILSDVTPEQYHLSQLYRKFISTVNLNQVCISFVTSDVLSTITYKYLHKTAEALARGLFELNLLNKSKDDIGNDIILIGVMANTRYEWFILEIASWLLNATLVPLYSSLGKESMIHILNNTEMRVAFAGSSSINQLGTIAAECKSFLKTIISFDDIYDPILGLKTLTMKDVVNAGLKSKIEFPAPDKGCIAQICYTSGTTGVPKGVVTTHKMIVSCLLGLYSVPYNIKTYTFML